MKGVYSYLISRLILGKIREIKKHPIQFIFLLIILLLFVTVIILSYLDRDQRGGWVDINARGSIITTIILVLTYLTLNKGLKHGTTFYRMADVNMLFTSPQSQRDNLMFGFLKQFGISLLVILWLFFQYANLRGVFGISGIGFLYFHIGVFLSVLYLPVSSMLMYRFLYEREGLKRFINLSLNIMLGIMAIGLVLWIIITEDISGIIYRVFNNPIIKYIPILGWIKTIMESSYLGLSTYTVISLILSSVTLILMVMSLYHSDFDFYEDVLLTTELRERNIELKRQGMSPIIEQKLFKHVKRIYFGKGASALLFRQLLEYRKTGIFLLDRSTLIVTLLAVFMGYLLKNNPMGLYYLLYISIYVLFFFTIFNKWDKEIALPYIYLIPASPFSKIWYATCAGHIKNLINGLLLFLIAGQIFNIHILTRVLLAFCYVSFGGIYIYGGIIFQRFLGQVTSIILSRFLVFMTLLILISPGLVAIIYVTITYPQYTTLLWLTLTAVTLYGGLITLIGMLLGIPLLSSVENTPQFI